MLDAASALPGPFEGQGLLQIGELLLAFALSSLVGLERQLRGKPAGLRTQALVGTTAALMLLVSKYGFSDVLGDHVVLDPSRVAAQIVSGVGFLGAGLILTRRGAVRGLTTAAAVWETAAIGMAAGAGLWLIALIVTALHFVTVYGYTWLAHRLPGATRADVQLRVTYVDGRGVLRVVLEALTASGWQVNRIRTTEASEEESSERMATVLVSAAGNGAAAELMARLGALGGVREVAPLEDDELE